MLALKVHSFFCLFMEARLTVKKCKKHFRAMMDNTHKGLLQQAYMMAKKKLFWVNYSLRAGGQSG